MTKMFSIGGQFTNFSNIYLSNYQRSPEVIDSRTGNLLILGPSGPRTIGPSDYRALGLTDPRTNGPSDYRALGIPGLHGRNVLGFPYAPFYEKMSDRNRFYNRHSSYFPETSYKQAIDQIKHTTNCDMKIEDCPKWCKHDQGNNISYSF